MYAGWHCTADQRGCNDMAGLADLLADDQWPAHRTISLIDPVTVGADRIFGAHDLRVEQFEKLRLQNCPDDESASTLSWADGGITLTLGRPWLAELARALRDVASGDADFAVRFGEKGSAAAPRISFWWWPKTAL
ncbi:hypothetical protein C7I55_25925 [Sphingomonas deserti]|uniref:Uncharacterized protein n=2 Tax=Allosphingosinicella deserti TaxID=2116704 RepID=A0A2P7QEW7_9SPHN|nr:hypothetical protein C7I55_25925 [Sphingomonas deserti]